MTSLAPPRTRRRSLVLVILAAGILLAVAVLASRSGTDEPVAAPERVTMFDGIAQDGPWLGAAGAPVVVEEFADLQCPFCADFATSELPAVVNDLVRPGRVRLRLHVLAFLGPDSVTAARAATGAAEQDRLWPWAEAFYARQGTENSGYVTPGFLRDVSEAAGVVHGRAVAAGTLARGDAQIHAAAAAAQRAGVRSTPTFVVRRRGGAPQVVGADGLRAAIDQALGA